MICKATVLLAVTVLALVFFPMAASAQVTYSEDIQVTHANRVSQEPRFVTDSTGNVHIVWTDQRTNRPEIYYTKLDNDGNSLIFDLQINDTLFDNPFAPHIGVDSSDNLQIVWSDRRDGNNELYYTKMDANGGTLVQDRRITNDSAFTEPDGLAVDAQDNVHVVFKDKRDGNFEIYYKKLDGSGNELVADTRISNDSGFSQDAAVAVDLASAAHIVWQDFRDGNWELYYAKVDASGAVVVPESRITNDAAGSEEVDVLVDGPGNVHVVWSDTRSGNPEIYYLKLDNTGGILVPATRVTNDPGGSFTPTAVLNSRKEVVVAWRDDRDGDDEIYLARLDSSGAVLQSDTRVTESAGQSSVPVVVTDSNDEAYLVWQDDRDGDLEVFFKRSYRCKGGTVNAGAGSVKPVLFVNGQIGGLSRTVYVPQGAPISLAIQKPPAGSSGNFVVHGDAGSPIGLGQTRLSAGVGTTCFDFLLPPAGGANPAGVWNNIGFPELVGASHYLDGTPIPDPGPAPTVLISRILGDSTVLPVGAVFTFQGIIKDQGSASAKLASTSNAVVLKIL